jgi:two-component system chemotaxis response regulator CheY
VADIKILAVDDSPTMRRIIVNTLKRAGFGNVVEAENGVDALGKLRSEGADFVITDWNMPEMDGLTFVTQMRADNALKGKPVLMVTTRSVKDDIVVALKAGVNGYIVKPFSPETLSEKINQVLKNA